jgi:hypothetical protein
MLIGALVAVVAAAVAVPLTLGSPDVVAYTRGPGPQLEVARQINLVPSDFPRDWTVDRSSNSPLSGFLGSQSGSSGRPTPQQARVEAQVARQFERCMGVAASGDRIFGPAAPTPSATASSPAFAAPDGHAHEAGSVVSVFGSSGTVGADAAQITRATFVPCFGTAIGQLVAAGAPRSTGGSGPAVVPAGVRDLSVPATAGVHTVGVGIAVSVERQRVTVPVEFEMVFVMGGRAEATLYTFGAGTRFPSPLVDTLTEALGRNVAADGSGTGA